VSAPTAGSIAYGLSYAVVHRAKHNEPIEGQYQRAQKYISDFHDFALGLQNADGSGAVSADRRSASTDPGAQLRSTGWVLECGPLAAGRAAGRSARDPCRGAVIRLLSSQRYGGTCRRSRRVRSAPWATPCTR